MCEKDPLLSFILFSNLWQLYLSFAVNKASHAFVLVCNEKGRKKERKIPKQVKKKRKKKKKTICLRKKSLWRRGGLEFGDSVGSEQ
jgi:hypothetical protein